MSIFFVKIEVKDGDSRNLRHVPGYVMIADLLTKAVARAMYLSLMQLFRRYSVDGLVCPS